MKKNIQFSHYDVKVRGEGGWKLTTANHVLAKDNISKVPIRSLELARELYPNKDIKFVPRYLVTA